MVREQCVASSPGGRHTAARSLSQSSSHEADVGVKGRKMIKSFSVCVCVCSHREDQRRGTPAGGCGEQCGAPAEVNTRLETQSSIRYRPPTIISSSSSHLQIINVDWVHVESRASDIAKSDKGVQMVLGQLIDRWVVLQALIHQAQGFRALPSRTGPTTLPSCDFVRHKPCCRGVV